MKDNIILKVTDTVRPRTLYALDQKLFGFLCRCVGTFANQSPNPLPPTEWRRIAIAKYMGMGSLILATPLMQLLKRHCPQAEVALLTLRQHQDLARMLPIQQAFFWDMSHWRNAAQTFLPFVKSVQRWRPDAFFDLEFFVNVSALIAWLSNAPVRVGFHHAQSPRGRLLTHTFPVTPRHRAELFLGLAWAVGLDISDPPPLWHPRYDLNRVSSEVRKLSQPFIVINPNAGEISMQQRRWMPDRFRTVMRQLLDEFPNLHCCVIGAKSEREYVSEVLADMASHPRIINLAGKLNLDELCFVLEGALVLITNDTGPMHLAAALGTPCVALFGPDTPIHYRPLGEGHIVFYKPPPCSPCMNPFDGKLFVCPFQIRCLRQINAEEVLEATSQLIKRHEEVAEQKSRNAVALFDPHAF